MNQVKWAAKAFAIAALFALLVGAYAQGGGGGGRGFGGQRGGMFGFGGNNLGLGLLMRADVQRDLALTADQKAQLQAISQAAQDQRRAMFEEMRNSGGGGNFEEMRATMEKMNAETDKKALAVLTDAQRKRAKEISVQLSGNRAILNPDIQKDLGMTQEQIDRAKKLQENFQAAMQALMQDMRDGALSREELQSKMEANNKVLDTELGKILTPAQADKLKAMGGAPFKADPPQPPPTA